MVPVETRKNMRDLDKIVAVLALKEKTKWEIYSNLDCDIIQVISKTQQKL